MDHGNVGHEIVPMLEDSSAETANLLALLVALVALMAAQTALIRVQFSALWTRMQAMKLWKNVRY